MENKIKAVLYNGPTNIEIFDILVDESNYELIIKKLESEKRKIINYFKSLKKAGKIKWINRPKIIEDGINFRTKKTQESLNNLVLVKKIINNSIETIKEIYH